MSTAQSAVLLIPNTITQAMIAAGTSVPVVDSVRGERAWNQSTNYIGNENKINWNGRLWSSIEESVGVEPGTDTAKWISKGPSNLMAPFDEQISTQALAFGMVTYVLRPGFFNGIALYGLLGDWLNVTLYDNSAGTGEVIFDGDMYEQAMGVFEYLYMPLRMFTKRLSANLPLLPDAELHVTVRASNNGQCGVGMIVCGFWASLLGVGDYGGVEYGANAARKNYSTHKEEEDGMMTIRKRPSSVNINCTVVLDADQANYAFDVLGQVGSTPVAIVLSGIPKYDYLNTFGLLSGSIEPVNPKEARLTLSGKGYI